MVYGHGAGLFFWGRECHHYEYPLRPLYPPDIKEGGTDILECRCSLTSTCVSVASCSIALGA
eukprot:2952298-Pleurochrysis_carterae.AAC.1